MAVRAPIIAGGSDPAETFRLALGGLWVPASALNVRTGVTTAPTLTGTGNFTATVSPFNCVIDGTSNAFQGCYPVALDLAATVTVNAASTQARVDLISLQILDNAYDASGQHLGQILYTAGTPGSGVAPTAPANSLSLFTVPVAANATSVSFASATSVFPYTAAAGGIVPVRSAADKPAVVSGVQYRHRLDVFTTSPSPLEWSTNGVVWNSVSGGPPTTWTPISTLTGFTASADPPEYIYNTTTGTVYLRGTITCNSATSLPTNMAAGIPNVAHFQYIPIALDTGVVASLLVQGSGLVIVPNGTISSGTGIILGGSFMVA